jgi:protein-S-isoprenylcysteine O-methyltransferase Ste14
MGSRNRTLPTIGDTVSQIEWTSATGAANVTAPLPTGAQSNTILDAMERLLVLGLYAYFVWRLLPKGDGGHWLANAVLLVSEGLVLVLFLIRRPAAAISTRRSDWLLALVGTLAPFLVQPAALPGGLVPPVACLFLMICGLVVQIHAKLSLGRSMGMVAADRGIKRSGPYQFVRHPMYAGYFLTHVAFWLLNPTGWNLAAYSCAISVQIMRLLAEERFLTHLPEYREYMQGVRFRLIPGVF